MVMTDIRLFWKGAEKKMSSYETLAGCYDAFTQDVDYSRWADYLTELFLEFDTQVDQILDLACGTGSLSVILAERGYEVIGVDASEDMLAVAQSKAWQVQGIPPMFLNQTMEELDLYGTVDAAVCCLDSLNYLTEYEALKAAFGRLRFFVRPGGLFIFDVNTKAKFEKLDGCAFLRDNSDYFCAWSAQYSSSEKLCTFFYDIFRKNGTMWSRSQEEHVERAHSKEEIEAALSSAGFTLEAEFGELSLQPPKTDEQRIFYVARRNR